MGATAYKHPLPYWLALALTLSGDGLQAQVVLDGTMGPAGPLAGPNYQIRAEYGQQRGGNLFHSFGVFNVNTGQSATFSGPNSVQNIIGRVTWGYPSSIDGALRSTIPGANLLLLNPAGVMFGPHATLDISGSFHVTTADYVRFKDGTLFDAYSVRPLLSVAPVEAFGFLSPDPAPIVVENGANLTVPTGETLSVIGGDVAVGGALRAPSGRLNIAAMSGPGEVKPTATELQTPSGQTHGSINVAGGTLSVSGDSAGSIFIRGGRFSVDGGEVNLNARGAGDGGQLDVRVQDMEVTNDGSISSLSAQGRGADINLMVDRLTLSNGGYIEASSGGTGAGGNLNITATEAVTIKGRGQYASGLYGYAYRSGDAGQLRVSAPDVTVSDDGVIRSLSDAGRGADVTLVVDRLTLSNGGYIEASSDGTGAGGNLTITATEAVTIQGRGRYASGLYGYAYRSGDAGQLQVSAPAVTVSDYGVIQSLSGTGRGADVTLLVDRLMLSNGGYIEASSDGTGAGGNLTITATEAVTIQGRGQRASGLYGRASDGDAGQLRVSAPTVTVANDGVIQSWSGAGRGADVALVVDRLTLSNGGYIEASSRGPGQGGNLTITAGEAVTIQGRGQRASGLYGRASDGDAGQLRVSAPAVTVADDGVIRSLSDVGRGADITLAVDRLTLTNGGNIEASSDGTGAGGNLTITATEAVTIQGYGQYASGLYGYAYSSGDAGQLRVSAPDVTVTDYGLIQSWSGTGRGADITLAVDRLTLNNGGVNAITVGAEAGGNITVTAQEAVSIAGPYSSLASVVRPTAAGNGGDITVTTPVVELTNGGFIATTTAGRGAGGAVTLQVDRLAISGGSGVTAGTVGPGQSGNIVVNARDSVSLAGRGAALMASSGSAGNVQVTTATGTGGDITVTAPRVEIADGAFIASETLGPGEAGDVTLRVDRLALSGGGFISTRAFDSGNGGDIAITAREAVSIGSNSTVVASTGIAQTLLPNATGDAGDITVTAPVVEVEGLISAPTGGVGDAGVITLRVDRLTLRNGGSINASTRGAGAGGDITVTARDAVSIAGASSSLESVVWPTAAGNGGDITVTAPVVELTDGGLITTMTAGRGAGGAVTLQVDRLTISGGGSVVAQTVGPRQGGNIVVNARDSVSLAGVNAALMARTGPVGNAPAATATGAGGDITVTAPVVELTDGGLIATMTAGPGAGGAVTLQVDRLALSGGSSVAAETVGPGQGGDIVVNARDSVSLAGVGASLMATSGPVGNVQVTTATGASGDITVTTPRVEIADGAFIASNTFGPGAAGDIALRVDRLTLSGAGSISASTRGSGRGGNIVVDADAAITISGRRSGIRADTTATGRGGNITMAAPQVDLRDGGALSSSTLSNDSMAGAAGDITLRVDRLSLNSGSSIATDTYGAGRGGNITINARGTVSISSPGTGLSAATEGTGDAGTITLEVGWLELSEGGYISTDTWGEGDGGDINVVARESISASSSLGEGHASGLFASVGVSKFDLPATGDGGDITVTAPVIELGRGGVIESATYGVGDAGVIDLNVDRLVVNSGGVSTSTEGAGRGGNIRINASDSVALSGGRAYSGAPGGLQASSNGPYSGDAGGITVTAPTISVSQGSQISSATQGTGNAGAVGLQVDRLTLSSGGSISASTTGSGRGGNIVVDADAAITISGRRSGIQADTTSTGRGGNITVTAPQVDLRDGGALSSSTLSNDSMAGAAGDITLRVDRLSLNSGSSIATETSGAGRGGNITINARGTVSISSPTTRLSAATAGAGDAGTITLEVGRLELSEGGYISTDSWGEGDGGDINVVARESISASSSLGDPQHASGLFASVGVSKFDLPATGDGGDITVTAPVVELGLSGFIESATFGAGDAGVIDLNVDRLVVNSGGVSTSTEGAGRGGNIRINASDSVALSGGRAYSGAPGGLQASSNGPYSGDAGGITVTAPTISVSQGSQISSATQGTGNAGAVTLRADRLTLSAGGEITTSTGAASPGGQALAASAPPAGHGGTIAITARDIALDNGRITSDTSSAGDAGNISLQGARLSLTNGGLISSSTQGSGRGGNIQIAATDAMSISGGNGSQPSGIYARSLAPSTGDAGDITLTTGRLTLHEGTTISAESDQASGGNIAVSARDIELRDHSTISSSVQGAAGSDGGNVTLDGERLIVWQGGRITARANQGQGGRITVNTDVFLHEAPRTIPDVLDASSRVEGNQGVVQINSQVLDLSGALTTLPADYLDASGLLSNRCTAAATARSTFVARGRGALPPSPGEPAPTAARDCLPAAPAQAQ